MFFFSAAWKYTSLSLCSGMVSCLLIVCCLKNLKEIVETVNENRIYIASYDFMCPFDLNYPVGRIKIDDNEIPEKINSDTYKIELILLAYEWLF